MFIVKGNIKQAIKELSNDQNNSVAHIYNPSNEGTFVATLKDLFATKDGATQASSKLLENFQTGYDATVVTKLKEAGASIVAKVHMDELALGGTGTYSAFGDIKNPLDNKRYVGGSSSGSAATFTKNISIALASDTGDSVRLPASYIGVVGFKPSYGAISRYGMFPFSSSLDTVSYFNHNVSDAIETSNILFGIDLMDMTTKKVELPIKKELKPRVVSILNLDDFLTEIQKKKMKELIKKLENESIKVKIVEIDKKLLEQFNTVYDVISFSEASTNNANLTGISFGNRVDGENWSEIMTNTRSKLLGKMVKKRMTLGAFYLQENNQEEIFLKAQKVRRVIVNKFNDIYKECDILIYPTAKIAPLIKDGKEDEAYTGIILHSNFAGSPSISIPFGVEEKLPFGISINKEIYKDKDLLSYSLYIEKIIGGEYE